MGVRTNSILDLTCPGVVELVVRFFRRRLRELVDGLDLLVDAGLGGADDRRYCDCRVSGEMPSLRGRLGYERSADPVEWALESMDCVVRSIAVSRASREDRCFLALLL